MLVDFAIGLFKNNALHKNTRFLSPLSKPASCSIPMSQTPTAPSPAAWCADLQARMMAALDAAWALIEQSDDPALIAKARDKARVCGQMAAAARKVAMLVPARKGAILPALEAFERLEAATGPTVAAAESKPPAAQAQAMRAALAKMKRR